MERKARVIPNKHKYVMREEEETAIEYIVSVFLKRFRDRQTATSNEAAIATLWTRNSKRAFVSRVIKLKRNSPSRSRIIRDVNRASTKTQPPLASEENVHTRAKSNA